MNGVSVTDAAQVPSTGYQSHPPERALPPATDLSLLQRAIILTVLYSDLFDYALTDAELRRYLIVPCPEPGELERALAPLLGTYLVRIDRCLTMAGREAIADLRRERERSGARGWRWAERYGRWLGRAPFVRMVAVCGSLAAGNARADADVDLFILTSPGRLWTAQVCVMVLRRVASLSRVRVCPNYFLALDSLTVEPRTLYTAREVVQAVPLTGLEAHATFLAANRWVDEMLPNTAEGVRTRRVAEAPRGRLVVMTERILAGRVGDGLERVLHRTLLLYYPVRHFREGWRREHVARAYRRDRQTVLGGGYGPAIERAFRERVGEWFPGAAVTTELNRLFPPLRPEEPPTVGPYARLFTEHYGRGRD